MSNPEKTVTATEISKKFKSNIQAKQKMFICPDCCEYVGFVYSTAKSSYFRHENSDGTRICEIYHHKNGNQPFSPYERAGLPLYLLRREECFSLNIGFYPIKQQALKDASIAGLSFSLFTHDHIQLATKYINEESFSSKVTVFLQLANRSKEYRLQFSLKHLPHEINEKWNNPIEGIEDIGAFFQFHEQGGLKIKKGGLIAINVDYYLLSQYDPRGSLDDSMVEKAGEIDFTTDYWTKIVFNVYRIKISSITERNKNFCFDRKALLVTGSPKFNPLWPPCHKQDQFYIYDYKDHKHYRQTALFLLNTPEATGTEHRVLTYPHRSIEIKQLTSNKSVFVVPLDNEETLITLDRPTAPFICGIKVKPKKEKEFDFRILVEDKYGHKFSPSSYLTLNSPSELKISANFIGLIQICDGFIIRRSFSLKERINLDQTKWRETIKIFHGLDLVAILEFKKHTSKYHSLPKTHEAYLIKELVAYSSSGSGMVPVPIWLKYTLPKLQIYPLLNGYIRRIINEGFINLKAKYKLENFLIKELLGQHWGE